MKSLLTVTILGLFVWSCSPNKSAETTEAETSEEVDMPGIELVKAPASPEYPNAKLVRNGGGSPVMPSTSEETVSNMVSYDFGVEGFELGAQTEDATTRGIANSGKGQHIHFIVNNGPYAAHYMDDINQDLEDGNYTILAFLSRSYHESVKSEGAYFVQNVTVGDIDPTEADLTVPHMFYSRPKGTYKGEDAKKVMLDFYLLNCTLEPNGYNVKATINGKEFLIDEWAPHYIAGLPMGEATIKLELMDAEGNSVDSPFNPVERTVTLEQ